MNFVFFFLDENDVNTKLPSDPSLCQRYEKTCVLSTSFDTDIVTSLQPPNSHQKEKVQSPILIENTVEVVYNESVMSDDPGEQIINDFTRDYVAIHGCKQNKTMDFSGSKRDYSDGKSR